MEHHIINTAVVIVGENLNPMLIHDSLLKANGVIPDEFVPMQENQASTPQFSSVKYTNNILLMSDTTRMQIRNELPPLNISESYVDEIAEKYVLANPQTYHSMGLNMLSIISVANPTVFLFETFMNRTRIRPSETLPLSGVDFTLHFKLDDALLHLAFKPGRMTRGDETLEGVIIDANYHMDIAQGGTRDEFAALIKTYPKRCDHFTSALGELFDEE